MMGLNLDRVDQSKSVLLNALGDLYLFISDEWLCVEEYSRTEIVEETEEATKRACYALKEYRNVKSGETVEIMCGNPTVWWSFDDPSLNPCN